MTSPELSAGRRCARRLAFTTIAALGFISPIPSRADPVTISNGQVTVRADTGRGSVDISDAARGRTIIAGSQIGFSVAPYVELAEVPDEGVETDMASVAVPGDGCGHQVAVGSGPTGHRFLSLASRKPGVGRLEVRFTLRPDQTFVEIGFSFTNLGERPVRLREVKVIDCDRFMPDGDRGTLRLLGGGSGTSRTAVVRDRKLEAENNLLCFFARPGDPRSLVAGGHIYQDFRKSVGVDGDTLVMRAWDPVGRRVDPGTTYQSPGRFYLDGMTDNPFEALEAYASHSRRARDIALQVYTFPSVCMWFLAVDHFGADRVSTNSTTGAVREMEHIAHSGFLKYSPVAVRLVPDCYEPNNQQGWWDDEHWQKYGRKERCVVDRHYEEPYETTAKWAGRILELGGIPLTYFQPGVRSEDYAEAFPEHMLYNQSNKSIRVDGEIVGDPHWVIGDRGIPDLLNPGGWHPGYGNRWQECYDFTDPGFAKHWAKVNRNLKTAGVRGVFYDYPDRAFPERGGMEDRYATATHGYREVFRIARRELGDDAWLQERIGPGSDATLDLVSSVRTAGDNNTLTPERIGQVAMRWYKNRLLTAYDMDGKALLEAGHGKSRRTIGKVERRAILTLSYAVSGRLLLTESFRLFPNDALHDLSRVFPFHGTPLSARPLDAFIREAPGVFDFAISGDWHQLVLYPGSEEGRSFRISVGGDTAFGGMGLAAGRDYYLYDFWNDRFGGKVAGNGWIEQDVAAGEARMLSVHAVRDHPQWISTNRHLMQGYVDLSVKPVWDAEKAILSGTSRVVAGEPYRLTLALNGYRPVKASADRARAAFTVRQESGGLADLVLGADQSRDVAWEVVFSRHTPGDESAAGDSD